MQSLSSISSWNGHMCEELSWFPIIQPTAFIWTSKKINWYRSGFHTTFTSAFAMLGLREKFDLKVRGRNDGRPNFVKHICKGEAIYSAKRWLLLFLLSSVTTSTTSHFTGLFFSGAAAASFLPPACLVFHLSVQQAGNVEDGGLYIYTTCMWQEGFCHGMIAGERYSDAHGDLGAVCFDIQQL